MTPTSKGVNGFTMDSGMHHVRIAATRASARAAVG